MIKIDAKPKVERMGVAALDLMVSSWGWAYRNQEIEDYGIDGHIEPFDETDRPSGRLIAVQVKSGVSYFERSVGGWFFRADEVKRKNKSKNEDKHLQYWLGHVLPVLVILYDPKTRTLYWQHVTEDRIEFTDRSWKIFIPEHQILDERAVAPLRAIADSMPSAKDGPLTASLPLLPPSAAVVLQKAYDSAPAGAMRLARMLARGRLQPELTAKTALAAQPSWLKSGKGQFEAAIGAFANDHGYPELALDAFTRAGEYRSQDAGRWFAVAGLVALALSELDKAEKLLSESRTSVGAGLLLTVGCAVHADLRAGDLDVPRTRKVLLGAARTELEAEPTCMVYLGQLAEQRLDLDEAIEWFEAAIRIRPTMPSAMLGKARALIARVGNGKSAVGVRDRTEAQTLAEEALKELRRWSGPSEQALAVLLATYMVIGAFKMVVTLATPQSLGGEAYDREASSGPVAVYGAEAALVVGDRLRAQGFADLAAGTDAETFIRALALDPEAPVDEQAAAWRAALVVTDQPPQQRRALYQLAALGQLTTEDLALPHVASNLDDAHHEILTARNDAAQGRIPQAILALRRRAPSSPAASEILIEVLTRAGRVDEALTECDRSITRFGADKVAHDKLNLLVISGRLPEAHAFAAALLAGPDLAPEQRITLRQRLIQHSATQNDWPTTEQQCREAYAAHPEQTEFVWGLITAQANQGRMEAAWSTMRELKPAISAPALVPLWMDLHARFGFTEDEVEAALDFAARWPSASVPVFRTLLSAAGLERPAGGSVLPELRPELLERFQRELAELAQQHPAGPIRQMRSTASSLIDEIRARLVPNAGRLDRAAALVRTGQLPLGALAVAAGRPYMRMLIEQTCGLQYACTLDGAAFRREVSAARQAFNGHVIVETSALYVGTLIPGRWGTLRSAFAEVRLPRPALVDIDAGRNDLMRAPGTSYSVGYDPINDVLVRHETAPADHQRLRQLAIAMDEAARELVITDLAEELQSPYAHTMWLASIELAEQNGLPLWSDDIAIRAIANGRSVAAFGTYALLTALVEDKLIPDTLRDDTCVLMQAGIADLVLTAEELIDLAAVEQWAPCSAASYFSRAASWTNRTVALQALLLIADQVWKHSPASLPVWFHAACVGIATGFPTDQTHAQMTSLAAAIMDQTHADDQIRAEFSRIIGQLLPQTR